MQQFIVPQFIAQENKIIGPITTRQFIILLVGGLAIALAYRTLPLARFAIAAVIIGIFVIVFAFVKINGQSFHLFLVNFMESFKKPKLRIWDKLLTNANLKEQVKKEEKRGTEIIKRKKPLRRSRLSELSLVVDTGGVYQGEDDIFNKK